MLAENIEKQSNYLRFNLDIDTNRQQKILEYCNKCVMAFVACVCV